jgi:dihydropteroate synthase
VIGCYRCRVAVASVAPALSLVRWISGATEVRPAVVGVVNVTPDSFSDGGRYLGADDAAAQVDRLLAEGADVIEIGGESTRPAGAAYGAGYTPVDADTQIRRVSPVIAYAAKRGARIAIDTTSPRVASAAIEAGARIVNDVSCMADPGLAAVVAAHREVDLVIMHAWPGSTGGHPELFDAIVREWRAAAGVAMERGVARERIVFDPGIGFGKNAEENLALIAGTASFSALGHPIYVGPSRKSFIASCEERVGLGKSAPIDRVGGTIAACLSAASRGAAALRVHDVRALRQALAVWSALGEGATAAVARAEAS